MPPISGPGCLVSVDIAERESEVWRIKCRKGVLLEAWLEMTLD